MQGMGVHLCEMKKASLMTFVLLSASSCCAATSIFRRSESFSLLPSLSCRRLKSPQ